MAKINLRIDLDRQALGPGKVRLLELIADLGSISAAGRAMRMSYTRAWHLVEDMNGIFVKPLVAVQHGGQKGGGAALTALGKTVVADYRAIEAAANRMAARRLARLTRAMSASAAAR